MTKNIRFSPEVRQRAVRMVLESQDEYNSQWAALSSIAPKIDCTPETLRVWVRQHQRGAGGGDGGFTVALAVGVPISTYVGGMVAWRPVLSAIAVTGMLGGIGLLLGMKQLPQLDENSRPNAIGTALGSLFNPVLLFAAFVTLLAYAGSFTAFTYIAPLLTEVTKVSTSTVGVFMLTYGIFALLGNVLGGKLTDQYGANKASAGVLTGIGFTSLSIWAFSSSSLAMGVLVALLGLFSYAAVPVLQARLFLVAQQRAPHAHGVASGLNIAGFNSGIAVGSVLGGLTINSAGLTYMGLTGAIVAGFALIILAI